MLPAAWQPTKGVESIDLMKPLAGSSNLTVPWRNEESFLLHQSSPLTIHVATSTRHRDEKNQTEIGQTTYLRDVAWLGSSGHPGRWLGYLSRLPIFGCVSSIPKSKTPIPRCYVDDIVSPHELSIHIDKASCCHATVSPCSGILGGLSWGQMAKVAEGLQVAALPWGGRVNHCAAGTGRWPPGWSDLWQRGDEVFPVAGGAVANETWSTLSASWSLGWRPKTGSHLGWCLCRLVGTPKDTKSWSGLVKAGWHFSLAKTKAIGWCSLCLAIRLWVLLAKWQRSEAPASQWGSGFMLMQEESGGWNRTTPRSDLLRGLAGCLAKPLRGATGRSLSMIYLNLIKFEAQKSQMFPILKIYLFCSSLVSNLVHPMGFGRSQVLFESASGYVAVPSSAQRDFEEALAAEKATRSRV